MLILATCVQRFSRHRGVTLSTARVLSAALQQVCGTCLVLLSGAELYSRYEILGSGS